MKYVGLLCTFMVAAGLCCGVLGDEISRSEGELYLTKTDLPNVPSFHTSVDHPDDFYRDNRMPPSLAGVGGMVNAAVVYNEQLVAGSTEYSLEFRGSTSWNYVRDLAVSRDLAVGVFAFGAAVYDIKDPRSPKQLAEVDILNAFEIDCTDEYATVLSYDSLVYLLDLHEPASTEPIFSWRPIAIVGEMPLDVNIVGDNVYVLSSHVFQAFDISQPNEPTAIGSHVWYSTSAHHSFDVDGTTVAIANTDGTIQILDISTIANPLDVVTFDVRDFAHEVCIADQHLYVADGDSGLSVFDLSQIWNPTLLATFSLPATRAVDIDGTFAYLYGDFRTVILSLQEMNNPRMVGEFQGGQITCIQNDYAYRGGRGLEVFDVSDKTSIYELATVDCIGETNFVQGAAVLGNNLYVREADGLVIHDVSALPQSQHLGGYRRDEWRIGSVNLESMAVDQTTVFLGSRFLQTCSLFVVDVSDPADCQVVDSLFYPEWCPYEMIASGQVLYVAGAEMGLMLFDITSSADLDLIASVDTDSTSAMDVVLNGSLAFVGTYPSGIQVVDLSDIEHPIVIEEFYGDSISSDYLSLDAGILIGTSYNDGTISLIDVSNPHELSLFSNYMLGTTGSRSVVVRGSRAYISAPSDGVFVLDVGDPAQPFLIREISITSRGVLLEDTLLFNCGREITIYNVRDEIGPLSIAKEINPMFDRPTLAHGGTAYLIGSADTYNDVCSLYTADIDNLDQPRVIGTGDFQFNRGHGAIENALAFGPNNYLYVASDGGLLSVDISDVNEPHLVSEFDAGGPISTIDTHGSLALVTVRPRLQSSQVKILDVGSPLAIRERSSLSEFSNVLEGHVHGVLKEKYAFVTRTIGNYEGQLLAIDLSHIDAPKIVGTYETGVDYSWADELKVLDNTAFMSTNGALVAIDVSDPQSPVGMWYINTIPDCDIAIQDSLLYVASGFSIYLLNVADPRNPSSLVSFYPLPSRNVGLQVSGTSVMIHNKYAFAEFESLLDIQTEVGDGVNPILPHHASIQQNYPNPFNPNTVIEFEIPKGCRVTLDLFNILGQKIDCLVDIDLPAGKYSRTWNGTNSRGTKVASGIYFYRLQAGDFSSSRRMLLLK